MLVFSLSLLGSCAQGQHTADRQHFESLSKEIDRKISGKKTDISTMRNHLKAADAACEEADRGKLFNETDAILSVDNAALIGLPKNEWYDLEFSISRLAFSHFTNASIDKGGGGLQSEPTRTIVPVYLWLSDIRGLDLVYSEKLYRKAITVETARGATWPAKMRENSKGLADCLREQGRDDEARQLEQGVAQNLGNELQNQIPWWKRLSLLEEQARQLADENKPDEAEQKLKLAVQVAEQHEDLSSTRLAKLLSHNSEPKYKGGGEGLLTTTPLESLASLYHDTHRYDREESVLLKVLSLHGKIFPPSSFVLQHDWHRLAECYRSQHKETEATKWDMKVNAVRKK
jgi:hypothetical protein